MAKEFDFQCVGVVVCEDSRILAMFIGWNVMRFNPCYINGNVNVMG